MPVPDVAFLVASPKLELELQTLVRVNPKIRVVIYTLEFSFMSGFPGCSGKRHPAHGGDAAGGLQGGPEGRDRGAAGALDFLWPGGAGITHKKRALFSGKEGNLRLDKAPASAYNILIKQSQSQWR